MCGTYEECLLQADIVVSNHILRELAEKLVGKSKFTKREAQQVIRAVRRDAQLVSPAPLARPICRDPDDAWILVTAAAGEVDVIVTGDKDLLVLKRFGSIPIVNPRGFLEFAPAKTMTRTMMSLVKEHRQRVGLRSPAIS